MIMNDGILSPEFLQAACAKQTASDQVKLLGVQDNAAITLSCSDPIKVEWVKENGEIGVLELENLSGDDVEFSGSGGIKLGTDITITGILSELSIVTDYCTGIKIIGTYIPEIFSNTQGILTKLEIRNAAQLSSINLENTGELSEFVIKDCQGVHNLVLTSSPIKKLDLRGVPNLQNEFGNEIALLENLEEIYLGGNQTDEEVLMSNIADLIGESTASNGTLYVNRTDKRYYYVVADAATSKGWTIKVIPD